MLQYFRIFKRFVGTHEKFVVVSFFAGIGGDLVALERLKIPVRLVIAIEKDPHCRRVLKSFLRSRSSDPKSSFYMCKYYCYGDICAPNAVWNSEYGVEALVRKFNLCPGRVIATGGSPCDNMPGTSNRGGKTDLRGQSGLCGEKTILFLVQVRSMALLLESLTAKPPKKQRKGAAIQVDWETGLMTGHANQAEQCATCNGTRQGETTCELGTVKLCGCHTALQALQWITRKVHDHAEPAKKAGYKTTFGDVNVLSEDLTSDVVKKEVRDLKRSCEDACKESNEARSKKRYRKVSEQKQKKQQT